MILIVKSALNLPRIISIFSTIAIVTMLVGCGQKGPLFMPAKTDTTKAPPSPPTPSPLSPGGNVSTNPVSQ